VKPFISRYEFVGEGEAGHQPALLEPKYRAEAAGEEDSLDAGEGDEALGEGVGGVDPAQGPLDLLGDAGDGVHGTEQAILFSGIFDVGFQEEAVHLGVDVLDGDLEAVESTGLGGLDFLHEAGGEVFENDAVGGGEEGEDVGDEVALAVVEGVPVAEVLGEVNLFGGPERGFGLLVHFPNLRVLDWEHAEPVWVRCKEWLFGDRRHCRGS